MCRRRPFPPVIAIAVVAALAGTTAPARADGPLTATLAATTDYVFRGVSQTYGTAAIQGGLNYQHPSGWFGGAWASNVEPYPGGRKSTELNLYGGFGWALAGDWGMRASYTRYLYAWDRRPARYDYGEIALALAFQDKLTFSVAYQPDSTGYSTVGYSRDRATAAYEVAARWPLVGDLALTGGVGYYDLTRLFHASYWAGDAGLSFVRGHLRVDLTHFVCDGTVRRLYEDASADGRWVLSAAWRF